MKKILIILVLCLGVLGCDGILNESDKKLKVLEQLNKNIPENLKNSREAIIGYCIELGTVAPDVIDSSCTLIKSNGSDKQLEFLNKNAQLIKDKSVSEAVEELQTEYNSMERETIFFKGMETIKYVLEKANSIPAVPENELKLLKIMNLSYMLGLDLSLGTENYMEKTGEILLNDNVEYQRTRYRSLKALSESLGK